MSQEDDDTPLNLPTIRIWDIDENSTHYDKMIAAPSDQDMKLMWIFWSLIMGVVAAFTGIVFVAILLDEKARKNPFNVYLLCSEKEKTTENRTRVTMTGDVLPVGANGSNDSNLDSDLEEDEDTEEVYWENESQPKATGDEENPEATIAE